MATETTHEKRRIFNYENMTETKVVDINDYSSHCSNIPFANNSSLYNKTISACGCLFYKIDNAGSKQLLLIKYEDPRWTRLDDFGGRVDLADTCVDDCIIRETIEESNNQINDEIMKKLLQVEHRTFYNPKSKYYSVLIKVDAAFFPDGRIFGDLEITDNIKRTINWYKYSDIKNNLAYRILNNTELIEHLDMSN
jgi:hypothetical protein